jgi:hypothetical protein
MNIGRVIVKKLSMVIAGIAGAGIAQAENLNGVEEMICAASQVQICIEDDTCYAATPEDLGIPDFVVIDTDKQTISTTKASGLNRSTDFSAASKADGLIYLQGIEGGRAFSFVIDETTGRMTVSVARDGFSVSVFGVCTDADI